MLAEWRVRLRAEWASRRRELPRRAPKLRPRCGEVVSGQGLRRLKGGQPEARHAEWMTRNAERGRKDVFSELLPIIHGWLDQAAPRITIGAESALRVTEAALKNHRGAIVEGMGERRIAVDPIEPQEGAWRRRASPRRVDARRSQSRAESRGA